MWTAEAAWCEREQLVDTVHMQANIARSKPRDKGKDWLIGQHLMRHVISSSPRVPVHNLVRPTKSLHLKRENIPSELVSPDPPSLDSGSVTWDREYPRLAPIVRRVPRIHTR